MSNENHGSTHEAARRRGMENDVSEARAVAVRYDRQTDQLVVTLRGGTTLLVPVRLLQGVAGAPPELIEEVTLAPRGMGLHWETLDADLLVQGLVAGSFGSRKWMHDLRRQGLLDEASLARLDLVEQLLPIAQLRGTTPTAGEMDQNGGSVRSAAKTVTAGKGGRKGGRPRKSKADLSPAG